MSDIAQELAKLHELSGADFSRQVEFIAKMSEFHPLQNEKGIYVVGGEGAEDYDNLLNAARKAVGHGYNVYILPNPQGVRTPDFIFERKGLYKVYDLKTILGRSSVANRLKESIGQTDRVLLNICTDYNARLLASDIKLYFEVNPSAKEVLVFKRSKSISVQRHIIEDVMFNRKFRKMYDQ